MSWVSRRQRARPSPGPAPGGATPRDEAFAERVARWRRWFAAHPGPSVDELQAEEAARRRRALEDEAEYIAACIARRGSYLPGDTIEDERVPGIEPGSVPGSWWVRW